MKPMPAFSLTASVSNMAAYEDVCATDPSGRESDPHQQPKLAIRQNKMMDPCLCFCHVEQCCFSPVVFHHHWICVRLNASMLIFCGVDLKTAEW